MFEAEEDLLCSVLTPDGKNYCTRPKDHYGSLHICSATGELWNAQSWATEEEKTTWCRVIDEVVASDALLPHEIKVLVRVKAFIKER